MKKFNTPIVITIYKRPMAVSKMLGILAKIQPTRIFIIADGPKNQAEAQLVEQTRQIIESNIDWPAKVEKVYADINLGLHQRIVSGLDQVFKKVDRAIILEDDCLPHPSFFFFCQELLEKYANNKNIYSISGDNFLFDQLNIKQSYYFSKYFHSWGWATWKRAWEEYDDNMSKWPEQKRKQWIRTIFTDRASRIYWTNIFDAVKNNKIDSWAYRWTYTHFNQKGISIIPQKNLVTNIGFGKNGTNTIIWSKVARMKTHPLIFPLNHPNRIEINDKADKITAKNLYVTPKNIAISILRRMTTFL